MGNKTSSDLKIPDFIRSLRILFRISAKSYQPGIHNSGFPDNFCQRPGIHIVYTDYTLLFKQCIQRTATAEI